MPITTLDLSAEDADEGQIAYEAICETVGHLDAATLMALVGHVQQGTPWVALPLQLRRICVELEGLIVAEDEGEG